MKDEEKRKLDKAFELGELRGLAAEGRAAQSYLKMLAKVDEALKSPPEPHVPSGFTTTVLRRLPSKQRVRRRIMDWRDFAMPVYLLVAVVVSLFFVDQLGLTRLLNAVSEQMAALGESGLEVVFIVLSSVGILMTTWLIVNSFFGIRSRRIVK
jgi:hypothetical protein